MSDIPVKEIGEMMDMATEKLPKMIRDIVCSLYSEEAARNIGKAVGTLYKELIQAGMPEAEALVMAKDYMNTLKSMAPNMGPNQ